MLKRQYRVGAVLINYYGGNYARGRVEQGVAAVNNDTTFLQMSFSDMQSPDFTDNLYNRNPLYWAAAFGQVDLECLLNHDSHRCAELLN